MRLTAKQYRDAAYKLRAHPREDEFFDRRDSFTSVYLSVLPFAIAEYFVEVTVDIFPGALIFPVGFLLFWAFYYTYYKPGFLENRLTTANEFDLTWVPSLIVGVLIWFVKVTMVELSHLVLFQWIAEKPAPRPVARPRATPPPMPPQSARPAVPSDVHAALAVLGLKAGCTWKDIHRQYRALAKTFHPDLNPEVTDFGHRFMKVDEAYRRLEKVRALYFAD